jgi:hypothetical protein
LQIRAPTKGLAKSPHPGGEHSSAAKRRADAFGKATDGERLPDSSLHFYTLNLVQESVEFLNNRPLKSALAPAQRIARIISHRGMEMFFPSLLDEFNHVIDRHSNLLFDFDARYD